MAGPQVLQSAGHSHWKQWWRRSSNTCCSKRILLLLVWQVLFIFSYSVLIHKVPTYMYNRVVFQTSTFLSYSFAPLIGWLADVRFGRYDVIKFGSIVSFLASILYYFAMFAGESASTLSTVLYSVAYVIVSFQFISYEAAMLPFLTDQIIGAASDDLSAVIRWYVWVQCLGACLSNFFTCFSTMGNFETVYVFAIPLAVIIISDCLKVSSGWTGLIRSLTPSSSSYKYSTTLGSTVTPRDAVPSPILHEEQP